MGTQQLSHSRKNELRQNAQNIQKKLDAYDKQFKAKISEKILQEAAKINLEAAKDENGQRINYIVHVFADGANGKVSIQIVKNFIQKT